MQVRAFKKWSREKYEEEKGHPPRDEAALERWAFKIRKGYAFMQGRFSVSEQRAWLQKQAIKIVVMCVDVTT